MINMQYGFCYVQDGEIGIPVSTLPTWWKIPTTGAILNLDVYNTTELMELGWYRYVSILDQDRDKNTTITVSSVKMLSGDFVVELFTTRDLTETEIAAISATADNEQLENIRSMRNDLLAESDIFIVPDKWELMSSEEKQLWAEYRQALRDLPQNISNPYLFSWPVAPNASNNN